MRTIILVTAVAGCGPSVGTGATSSATGTTAMVGSSGTASVETASVGASTTHPTTSADDTTATVDDGTSVGETEAPSCSDRDPVAVPEPPPGCEHVLLHDERGQPDPMHPSGLWSCGDPTGFDAIYRVQAVACACEHHHPPCRTGTVDDCGSSGACGIGQSCVDYHGSGSCSCLAQCNQDADCPAGNACACAAGVPIAGGQLSLNSTNRCISAGCLTDEDCPGERCRLSSNACGQPDALQCTTPADECSSDADCPSHYCAWDSSEARWICGEPIPCD